jgi:hypothetical protein
MHSTIRLSLTLLVSALLVLRFLSAAAALEFEAVILMLDSFKFVTKAELIVFFSRGTQSDKLSRVRLRDE